MKYLALVTLVLLANSLLAQDSADTGIIKGRALSNEGDVLEHVNVGLTGTAMGTSTSADGSFVITEIPTGQYELQASYIGFESTSRTLVVRAGDLLEIDLILERGHYMMPQVNIFADRIEGIFETVPGSLTWLDNREIEVLNPISTNEVLRRSPGVHVVEEEGVGMRMNLAIRGLDAARSRSTLMLEDGIPLALAPYGEPEMYYAPVMEKIQGVEILKGSGSVLYGPQTIGGVVNFITKDPPAESTGELFLRGGQGGLFSGLLSHGNTFGKAGYQVNIIRKQGDNIGPTMFRINDLSSKFKFQLNHRSYLGVKLGVYDETSNSTYVGMTRPMYDSGEYDYISFVPHDRLNVSRYNLSVSHDYFLSDQAKLTTTVFGYTTTRNWQRQDFSYNRLDSNGNPEPKPYNFSGVILGNESMEEGAIYLLNSSGNRNRSYEIAGSESRMTVNYNLAGMEGNELTAGLRFLFERAYEQRINGNKPDAPSGDIVSDEIRTGYGRSAYMHNRFNLTPSFSLTAGLRMEFFDDSRNIRRGTYTINDERQVRDTSIVASTSLVEFIPGAGFNYKIKENTGLFGGIHRGFAPPRTKDAISYTGRVYGLKAEKSWNYELGLRTESGRRGIRYELTAVYMDFSNQVIPVAEHAGGVGAGATNAGATFHRGFEKGLSLDFGNLFDWRTLGITYDAGLGYVQARFNSQRFMDDEEGGKVNVNGNHTPYAPEWLLSSALTLEHRNGLAGRFNLTYVSDQFSDPLNRVESLNNGREGLIPAYHLIDINVRQTIRAINSTVSLSVKNLMNRRYIASRRPQGIMLGTPRLIIAGVKYHFN